MFSGVGSFVKMKEGSYGYVSALWYASDHSRYSKFFVETLDRGAVIIGKDDADEVSEEEYLVASIMYE